MKVQTLQTKDFKGLPDGVYNFTDDNIITGRNGSGKSSIAEAIAFCLYGRTITGNSSTSDLIHGNAESTTVALQFDTGTTVVREESRFYGTTIKLNGDQVKQEDLEANLPNHQAFLAVFIIGYFTNQDESDQRKLILDFAPPINYQKEFDDYTGRDDLAKKHTIDFLNLDKAYKNYSSIQKQMEDLISSCKNKIEWTTNQISTLAKPKKLTPIEELEELQKKHQAFLANEDSKKFNDNIYGQIAKIEAGECPTCKQRLSVDSITGQVKELKAKLVKVDQKIKKPKGELSDIIKEIQDARVANELFNNYEEQVLDLEKQKADASDTLRRTEEELVDIRIIVKALSPKGMRADAARSQIKPILAAIEKHSDESLPITIDTLETLKNGNVREVFKIKVNGVPFKYLSTGEKKRVSIAFSKTINDLIGSTVNMYYLDDAELISGDVILSGQVFKAFVSSGELTVKEG